MNLRMNKNWIIAVVILLGLSGCQQGCNGPKEDASQKYFRFNLSSGLASLDPAFAKDQSVIWICNQLYNPLIQLDDSLNVKPCIAKSWDISEDGKTYTFHLRSDVKFHNDECFANGKGRLLNARDVVYSFNRIVDPKVASPGLWIFNHNVDAAEPFKAVDDTTFVLKLSKPFRPMLGILTMQYCSIVPEEAVNKYKAGFRAHAVGTGPFMLKNWKEGVALIMVKNPDYFEKENGQQLPYLDGVKVTFIDNKKTEYLSFMQHQLDFFNSVDGSYIDEVLDDKGELKPNLRDQFNLRQTPYLNTEYLGFNISSQQGGANPFSDKRVRQAINYGFDRREMLRYLRKGVGMPAESGFSPYGLPSFDTAEVKGYNYNPEKAKALLKEAGHENGKGLPPMKLYTNETYKEFGLFIARKLEQIGLNVTVEVTQPGILREWMVQGKVQFFRGSWLADHPDAENYFACFYSKNGAPPNYTRFNNAAFDALYEKSVLENDNAKRYALYHQMDKIIIEEATVVPLYYDRVLHFSQKNVEGLNANGMNILSLKLVKLK